MFCFIPSVVNCRRYERQLKLVLTTLSFREFRVLKSSTFKEVMGILSQAMGYREDQLCIWPFSQRTNQTYRPTVLELDEPSKSVSHVGSKLFWVSSVSFYLLPSIIEGISVCTNLLCYVCKLAKVSDLLHRFLQDFNLH